MNASMIDYLITCADNRAMTETGIQNAEAARTELAQLRAQAARVAALEAAIQKDVEALEYIVKQWRDHAQGHYCQTYNKGMAEGLETAALGIEIYIDARKLAAHPRAEAGAQEQAA